MTVLSEEQLFVENQKTEKKPRLLSDRYSLKLEADQLETEQPNNLRMDNLDQNV